MVQVEHDPNHSFSRDVYECLVIHGGTKWMTLWDAEADSHLCQQSGRIPLFAQRSDFVRWLSDRKAKLLPDRPVPHDLDRASRFGERPQRRQIACAGFLDVLNLCEDAAKTLSTPPSWEDQAFTGIYNKLFFGSNLPSINQTNPAWTPKWTDRERGLLARYLQQAVVFFVSHGDFRS